MLADAGLHLLAGHGDLAIAKQGLTLLAHLVEPGLMMVKLLLLSSQLLLFTFSLLLQRGQLSFAAQQLRLQVSE